MKYKSLFFTLIFSSLFGVNIKAQSNDEIFRFYLKLDDKYLIVDNSKDNWFTLELKADTIVKANYDQIIYNNKKLLQISVLPYTEFWPKDKKIFSIPKVLNAYKKWELNFQQQVTKSKLKNGQDFFIRKDDKPFLIWWYKVPQDVKSNEIEISNLDNRDTSSLGESKTLNATYMLSLVFSINAKKVVAMCIPVFEDENLTDEIGKLKEVANSLITYAHYIDLDVLFLTKKSKEKYILKDSLNFLNLDIPDWLNVLKSPYENSFFATFPEKNDAVNAMIIKWDYKSNSLTFNDFINNTKINHQDRPNYRLIKKNDSIFNYFYTSEDGWYYQQNVYLKGDNIFCCIVFTATYNTYDYNVQRFEEILKNIKLK